MYDRTYCTTTTAPIHVYINYHNIWHDLAHDVGLMHALLELRR